MFKSKSQMIRLNATVLDGATEKKTVAYLNKQYIYLVSAKTGVTEIDKQTVVYFGANSMFYVSETVEQVLEMLK